MKTKTVKEMTHHQRKEHLERLIASSAALMAKAVANEEEFAAKSWAKSLVQYVRLLRNMNSMHDEMNPAIMTYLHL